MNTESKHPQVLLLIIFILLQLCGQTAAGFSGKIPGVFNLFSFISYCCLFLRSFVWLVILKKMPLTLVYPFTAAVYILVIPLSQLVFGESPDWSIYAGGILITAGIIITSAGAKKVA